MVNNAVRQGDGMYHVGGRKYKHLVGSRVMVWNGSAEKTQYGRAGLRKKDLVKNKWGRIVSRKKHNSGKKNGLKRLHAKGYFTRKGKFGVFKKGSKSPKRRTKKRGRKKKTRRICRHKSGKKKGKYKKCPKRSRRRRR